MNMKAQKPLQSQVKVDLSEQETMKCESCGNYLFIVSYVIKKLSAIVSPSGQAGLVPVQVYSCGNCGEVPTQLLESSGLNVKERE
jgi:uncharacterized Zn finger protein